jgi:gliding motility-associated-like protein
LSVFAVLNLTQIIIMKNRLSPAFPLPRILSSFVKKIIFSIVLLCAGVLTSRSAIITSFAPAKGPVGTLVTLKGTNLLGVHSVKIGGVVAILISKENTKIVAMVMPGATTGNITLFLTARTSTARTNFTVEATPYPLAQQGDKIADTEPSLSPAYLDISTEVKALALSADGNTAIVAVRYTVGGGAAIYTRTAGNWQQASPVIRYELSGIGTSVAISADGATAVMGGVTSGGALAKPVPVLILKRVNGSWSTPLVQHLKNSANQPRSRPYTIGNTISITADGNTIVVAAGVWNKPPERGYNGIDTVKIFNRAGNVWLQTPTPSAPAGYGRAGMGGTISADGKTLAVIGQAYNADRSQGYTAVYHRETRTSNTWVLQFKTGEYGRAYLSANGNTLITTYDSQDIDGVHYPGLTRVWERTGTTWQLWQTREIEGEATISADGNTLLLSRVGQVYTRQTRGQFLPKLDLATQFNGVSAALSADGSTALIGRPGTGSAGNIGAFYAFSVAAPQIPITAPTTPATGLEFVNNSLPQGGELFWTNGNGTARSVFIKVGASGKPVPSDGYLYTAGNNPYTDGDPIHQSLDNDEWHCVYTGTGSYVQINGLQPLTTYRVAVVDYNGGYLEAPTAYIKNFNVLDITTPILAPTQNPQNFEFRNTTAATSTLSWTRANGAAVVVFVKKGTDFGFRIDDFISHTANNTFGLGSMLAQYPGYYCIYNGTGTSVDISGLEPSTHYIATVLEYNGGPGQERYAHIASGAEVTTAAAPTLLLTSNQKLILVEQDILEDKNIDVNVHQALSPNGDGVNDVFIIDGIGAYPENTVKVLNTNGELIYSAAGYNNYSKVFDGHAANGTLGKAGTYFYSLEYKKGTEVIRKTGYLVLKY